MDFRKTTIRYKGRKEYPDLNSGDTIFIAEQITEGGGGSSYVLPHASSSVLGGIKVGNNLTINPNGTLSATGVQSQDVTKILKITKADYDALAVKDNNTLYLVIQ